MLRSFIYSSVIKWYADYTAQLVLALQVLSLKDQTKLQITEKQPLAPPYPTPASLNKTNLTLFNKTSGRVCI
jgi:hypothetical protein